jgi:hypothetical protein
MVNVNALCLLFVGIHTGFSSTGLDSLHITYVLWPQRLVCVCVCVRARARARNVSPTRYGSKNLSLIR